MADPNDPAVAIVEDLIEKYPNVQTKLIIGQKNVGPNPKINNMIRSYEEARHDLVLISDSNIRVSPDCLEKILYLLYELPWSHHQFIEGPIWKHA